MIEVVLCASGRDEVRIVHDLAHYPGGGVRVVRRCADLAETLAVASSGIGDVVLVDLDLRGLGREHLADLLHNCAVVGLHRQENVAATGLGLSRLVPVDADISDVVEALRGALDDRAEHGGGFLPEAPEPEEASRSGRMIAVWGPVGAPGRSTVAVNLAAEAAAAGTPTVLVDADTYGPCLAQMIGVLEESPGIVAACRAEDRGTLDATTLNGLLDEVRPSLRLLTGIGVPRRWAELRVHALDGLWKRLRATSALTVVDVAGVLEEDEDLSYDTLAPLRNAAATTALHRADAVIAVVSADPVSITRLLRQRERLEELGATQLHVVVNRLAPPVSEARLRDVIASRLPLRSLTVLPEDGPSCRTAQWEGSMLCETAGRSALRQALRELALSEAVLGTSPVTPPLAENGASRPGEPPQHSQRPPATHRRDGACRIRAAR